VQAGATCQRESVRISGSADAAAAAFATRLVHLGYGVGGSAELCRTPPNHVRTCGFMAERDYFDHGERAATVYLALNQVNSHLVTGWVSTSR
jgi:hypothetical protein